MSIIFNSLFNTMWVGGLFQQLFLAVDSIIYGIAGRTYNLFNSVVSLNDYGNASSALLFKSIPGIINRLKTLFIIFMLFRLAFTLLSYLADPDKFSDSKSGSSKLIMNVVVSLSMLIASSYAFDLFNRIQYETMGSGNDGSNIIANIVFGDDGHIITGEDAGPQFVNKVFLLFCNFGDTSTVLNVSSFFSTSARISFLVSTIVSNNAEEAFGKVYNGAPIISLAPYISSTKIYYWPFISGIAGIFLIYFFFSFAIDTVIRLFKLKILEVISPIPILMYMDSDGQKFFKNFAKLYISTFLSFYLKLAAIYLAVVLANNVLDIAVDTNGIWLKLVVILGVFYLTKELPKIFKELFGIDLGDGKMKGSKFLSGLAGVGIGAAVGGFMGATSGAGVGGSLISAATGAARGGYGGGTAQNVGGFIKGQVAAGKGNAKQIDKAKAVGGYGAMAMHGIDSVTGANKRSERDIAAIKNVESKRATMQSTTESEFARSKISEKGPNWGTKDEFVNNDIGVQKANTALQEYYKKVANDNTLANDNEEKDLKANLYAAQDSAKTTWSNGYNSFVNEAAKDASNSSLDVSTISASARAIRDYNETVDSSDVKDALERNVNRADEGSRSDVKNATNIQKVEYVSSVGEFGPLPVKDHASTISDKEHKIANATAGVNASRQAEYKRNSGGNQ